MIGKREKIGWVRFSVCTAAIFLCIFGYGLFSENRKLIREEKQQLETAGMMEDGKTQEEILYHIFQGEEEKALQKKGRQVYARAGFEEEMKARYQSRMVQYIVRSGGVFLGAYLLITAAAYIRMREAVRRKEQEFEQFGSVIEQFYTGHYQVAYREEEGMKSRLFSRLNSLGKRLEVQEKKIQDEKETTKSLVTDISHQLKTPVASLKMCLELLAEEDLSKEEQKEFLGQAVGQTQRLDSLTKALINISRMETGMISVKKIQAPIMDTIAQAVSSVYVKAQEKNIEIEVVKNSDEAADMVIPHDPHWTREAIANILENAVKYSGRDTCIQIRMMKRTSFLRIEIEDQGIGIDSRDYTKIFQRFYRGTAPQVKEADGSGVGLYLTRSILEAQGGSVSVSAGKQGSIFTIHVSLTDL
ncbi:sensor histidine kinase [Anaerostipes caccae]|uniref:sensor histidine kinase n=1 Tax=Anaerostipes caccae TaxID=105841 RepID=UPI0038D414A5